MEVVAVFPFGAVVGSFLNVCIHRLPQQRSIVRPGSQCPRCSAPIRFYDNIPILSYLFLRGQCRRCGAPISLRYPLVELLTGLAAVGALWLDGLSLEFLVHFALLSALIVITFIDIDYQIIPDVISLPGILVGFAASTALGEPGWVSSLLGILLGGGILWLVAEVYVRLRGQEGMGGGDVKLLAMIGAFLGWRAIPVTLMLASLLGSVVGLVLIAFQGRDTRVPIPFGPFLAAGAVVALFFGEDLIAWYLSLARGS